MELGKGAIRGLSSVIIKIYKFRVIYVNYLWLLSYGYYALL